MAAGRVSGCRKWSGDGSSPK